MPITAAHRQAFSPSYATIHDIIKTTSLHKAREASPLGLLDERLDFLRTSAGGDHESIGNVDNNQIVDTQASNQATGARDNDTTKGLLRDDCTELVVNAGGVEVSIPSSLSPRTRGALASAGSISEREEKSPTSSQPVLIS